MAGRNAFTIASLELLPAAPAFVTRVEKVKIVSLNAVEVQTEEDLKRRVCIPNPVYPSAFASSPSVQISSKGKRKRIEPVGFKNPKNACHLNAVLAAVLSLPILQQTRAGLHNDCKKVKNCGVCAFKRLFDKFMPLESAARPVSLACTSFGKLFEANHNISSTERNDASRVLMKLLQYLRQEEIDCLNAAGRASKRTHQSGSGASQGMVYDVEDSLIASTTAVGRYFSFVVRTTLECKKCSTVAQQRRELHWNMPVYLNSGIWSFTDLLLANFNGSDDPRTCAQCSNSSLTEFWDLIAPPRCLIVQIITQDTERPKLNYLDQVNIGMENIYSLVSAVCVEKGEQPHYFALTKQSRQEWLMIDDECVSRITADEAQDYLNEGAHLLFMENTGETIPFDQPTDPWLTTVHEPSDCSLAEQLRVTDFNTQQVTGLGLNQPVRLDLIVNYGES